jgi:DNA-binding transcriptional LysR family regulator
MGSLNEAITLARRIGEGKTGTLNIGYGSLTLLHSLFRAAIKEYHENFPEVTLSLFEIATSAQPKALAERKIHAGFMHFGPQTEVLDKRNRQDVLAQEQTVLDWVLIQSGGLGVVMPIDHPLARRKSLALFELSNENYIVVPRSSSSPGYGPLFTLCQQAGFQPKIVQEVSSVASQLNLISVGMGIGLAVIGKNFSYPTSTAVVPLKAVDYETNFVFGWVQGQTDPALEQMINIVKALAKLQSGVPVQNSKS